MKQPSRPLLIMGNWKMYKTVKESLDYLRVFEPLLPDNQAIVALAVPFTAIRTLADNTSRILIGAQNMNDAEEGAFTGEIAGRMLKEVGAHFVLLGHSERRRFFHESNGFINKKVRRALMDGLQPILCIGESLSEREQDQTEEVLRQQICEGLAGVENPESLILAYEPLWAIGSSNPATTKVIENAHQSCREVLRELFGEAAEQIPILYGGSVNSENAQEIVSLPNVDGLLVGGASLLPESFAKIVHLALKSSF